MSMRTQVRVGGDAAATTLLWLGLKLELANLGCAASNSRTRGILLQLNVDSLNRIGFRCIRQTVSYCQNINDMCTYIHPIF